ncbi:methyltransferase [Amycolatopsis sp. NPDC059090]|uniref:methyltransferase n=1 Tax=unclassified Amycolatopsis TaxID=2618356 RepID=UPI00366C6CA9
MADGSARSRLLATAVGYMSSQAVHAAAQLGIADLLADGPLDRVRLARACDDSDVASMDRLLRALVACEVLSQDEQGRYSLTEVGEALRSEVPGSARDSVLLYCSEPVWQAWSGLRESVRAGTTAFAARHGMGAFEYCARHPETARIFHRAMAEETAALSAGVVEGCDFAGVATVADVGGGNGTLLAGILRLLPGLSGVLVDTEHGLRDAPEVLAGAGVADRCEIVVADFFDRVPAADLYLLKSIVHDWSDEDARRLLASCRRAMRDDGTLVLVERVMPARLPSARDPLMVRNLLNMPTMIGGRERTAGEFAELLAASGFSLAGRDKLPGSDDHWLLRALPAASGEVTPPDRIGSSPAR